MSGYAELQVTSNFSFLRGGAHPEELVERAAELGLSAIALTDRNSLAGVVRAHVAAKNAGITFIVGCRLDFEDRPSILVYPTDKQAYARLSRLLTLGKRRAPKGHCYLRFADLVDHAEGLLVIALPPTPEDDHLPASDRWDGTPISNASKGQQSNAANQIGPSALGVAKNTAAARPAAAVIDLAVPPAQRRLPSPLSAAPPADGAKAAPVGAAGSSAAPDASSLCEDADPWPAEEASKVAGSCPDGRALAGVAAADPWPPDTDAAPGPGAAAAFAPNPAAAADRGEAGLGAARAGDNVLGGTTTEHGCEQSEASPVAAAADAPSARHHDAGLHADADRRVLERADAGRFDDGAPTPLALASRARGPERAAVVSCEQTGRACTSSMRAWPRDHAKPAASARAPAGACTAPPATHAATATADGQDAEATHGTLPPARAQALAIGPDAGDRDGMDPARHASASDSANTAVAAYPSRVARIGDRPAVTIGAGAGDTDNATAALAVLSRSHRAIGAPVATAGPFDTAAFRAHLEQVATLFPGRAWLAAAMLYRGDDEVRLTQLQRLSDAVGLPLIATNDVHYHVPERRPLQDVLTCIRHHCTIHEAGTRLLAHAERHLKAPEEMTRLVRICPQAIEETENLATRCTFSLDELAYTYPSEQTDGERSPQAELEQHTFAGAAWRYPDGVPVEVDRQIRHELALIAELQYAPYFLTVYEVVRFARTQGILCQGRGSAANSAVCYCLGITSVDPVRMNLLFERFVSAERGEPPDIDVDFEHERREEVIQYIFQRYGREHAGIAATVISYRGKSAVREVGKALGLSADAVGALSKTIWGHGREGFNEESITRSGIDPNEQLIQRALALASELIGFPRHLSQHVGGFVISRAPLIELCPVENAAMADRTMVCWDKDDLDALGMIKVDVLALGMLTAVRKAFELLRNHYKISLDLASIPPEDPIVYAMLCRADSMGVFQVESRAQMAFLPRMKPRTFYDLVIEVAIVRPGPIQGDMVHPYIRRREGLEPVEFPSDDLRQVLGKTLGVPLFQEQAMKIAIVAAGFTPSESDALRRAMATFKRPGLIHQFQRKMIDGMIERGYERDFAERCFRQIEGFGSYGFPESHAASFALLVYVSAWLKCHYPDVFACALLNSQPLGFYAPAQLVRDARNHGVEVRPVDVNFSFYDNSLEPMAQVPGKRIQRHALRLGLRQVKGLHAEEAQRLVAHRAAGYGLLEDLKRRGELSRAALEKLAAADAFGSLGLNRRQALWRIGQLDTDPPPLFAHAERRHEAGSNRPREVVPRQEVDLPEMTDGEVVTEDYLSLRLSLNGHPCGILRHDLKRLRTIPNSQLEDTRNGQRLRVAGLAIVRQRPGSAKGVCFITIEDETGIANIVIWPDKFEECRHIIMTARLLAVEGRVQRNGQVIHVVAERMKDISDWLDRLVAPDARPQPGQPIAPRLPKPRSFH
ncbi:MAG: error-prone DNA polymerase [Geminicoccaceae bacterium]